MSRFELVLTTPLSEIPEALREAALSHLAQATGRSLDELRNLLTQVKPTLMSADSETLHRVQIDLARAGWRTEQRQIQVAVAAQAVACPACGHSNAATSQFCSACGASLAGLSALPRLTPAGSSGGASHAASKVGNLMGLNDVQGFNLSEMLSEVFKRRTGAEVEESLMAGTERHTPPVHAIDTSWPKPWLFARMFLLALVTYAMFHIGWLVFQNANLLPGWMMVGATVFPLAIVVLLFECNAPRNVSFLLVLRLMVIGGILSLLISLVLFKLGADLSSLMNASAAGLIEETGKLATVVFATRGLSSVRYRYTLNGVLFGAAVGAGFAIFETAGYIFRFTLQSGMDLGIAIVYTRGLTAPFAHVIWTALSAGALWRVKGAMAYNGAMLADGRFLRIFFLGMALHATWNWDVFTEYFVIKALILGFIAWAVARSLIHDGLLQVRREQACSAGLPPALPAGAH